MKSIRQFIHESTYDQIKYHLNKWRENGQNREEITKLAKQTTGNLRSYHPGTVEVYRGTNDDSENHLEKGTAWSTNPEVAKKYAVSGDNPKIFTFRITPEIPALDINRCLPNVDDKDREIFIPPGNHFIQK